MTKDPTDAAASVKIAFRKLPGFTEISEKFANKLRESCSLVRFRMGQPLADPSTLPAQAYWIIEGECRLLCREEGSISTLAKIGPGSSIGVASLLRAEPCEMITASTPVLALSVPDQLIVELYQSDNYFREWCETTIWPAELASILERNQINKTQTVLPIAYKFQQAIRFAQLITTETGLKDQRDKNSGADYNYFIASANSELQIGEKIGNDFEWPAVRPPFNLRIIVLPLASQTVEETSDKVSDKDSVE